MVTFHTNINRIVSFNIKEKGEVKNRYLIKTTNKKLNTLLENCN